MAKIWANSGDSHFVEPPDLWTNYLPPAVAERMPRSVKDPDGAWETIYVDGSSFRRKMPTGARNKWVNGKTVLEMSEGSEGIRDVRLRMTELDDQGVWAEVCYPSLGLWQTLIKNRELAIAGAQAINDWSHSEILSYSPRLVPVAELPLLDVDDAVQELQRSASRGFKAFFMPIDPPEGMDTYNRDTWEPLWSAAEEANMVAAFHIGTENHELAVLRGPGARVASFVETSFGAMRVTIQMVSSGALERHPGLRVLLSEGGASWVPFIADRMDEAYNTEAFVSPRLARMPKEYVYDQVYASFQHDPSAIPAMAAMGYQNVMFGSDYPHVEGTYPRTQEILAELFAGASDEVRYRITQGAFLELFPHVGAPPAVVAA